MKSNVEKFIDSTAVAVKGRKSMIVKEYLIARRLANLYWAGFKQKTGCYQLKWSQLRELAEGEILNSEEMEDLSKYLYSFGFLIATSEEGVIVWHRMNVNPREIPEYVFHHALRKIAEEDETEIEDEVTLTS